MYKTDNWEILVPRISAHPRTYDRSHIEVCEGDPITFTEENAAVRMEIEKRKFNRAVQRGKVEGWNEAVEAMKFRYIDSADDIESLRKSNDNFSPGPQWRLGNYSFKFDGILSLDLSTLTDYGEFLATNVAAGIDPEYREFLLSAGRDAGDEDAFFANILAVCGAIETRDSLLAVGLRGDNLAEYKRCYHVVSGGHPKAGRYHPFTDRPKDPFDALAVQIQEEAGTPENKISDIRVTGLVRNLQTRKPELCFYVKVDEDFAQLEDFRRRDPKKEEHLKIFGIRKEDLAGFLRQTQDPSPEGFVFPPGYSFTGLEVAAFRPKDIPENTSNRWVPPGEACMFLAAMHNGIDAERELPYIQRI